MAGFRAYFDFSQNTDTQVGSLITLSQDESRHLCGSLRAKSGESVDIFDLNGNFRHCEIIDANQKRTQLKIIEKISVDKGMCADYGTLERHLHRPVSAKRKNF